MLIFQVSDVLSGIGTDPDNTKRIAKSLEKAIGSEINVTKLENKTIKAGNLNASLEVIEKLSRSSTVTEEPPSFNEIEVKLCSTNLFDKKSHCKVHSTNVILRGHLKPTNL